jgi:hypothetical protein
VSDLVQHPDTQTADFTVLLKGRDLVWRPSENGSSTTNVIFKVVSLTGGAKIVAARVQDLTVSGPTQNATNLSEMLTPIPVTVRVPINTQSVRIVVERQRPHRSRRPRRRRHCRRARDTKSAPQAKTPSQNVTSAQTIS